LFIVYEIYYFSHVFGARKKNSDGKHRFPVKFNGFRSVPGSVFSDGIRSERAEFRPVGADSVSPRAEAAGRADSGVFCPVSGDFRGIVTGYGKV